MRNHFIQLLTAVCCLWAVNAYAKINLDTPPEVPPGLNSRDFRELMAMRESLMGQFDATRQKIDRQAGNCQSVEKGSPKAAECSAEAQEVKSAVRDYRKALEQFKLRVAESAAWRKFISDMNNKAANKRNPHAIAVESHGEFHIVTADGRKLSGQDAAGLNEDDDARLVTGPDGWAFLTLPDDTRLRLGSNTEFLTKAPDSKPDPDDKHPVMELAKGTLRWVHEWSSELSKELKGSAIGRGRWSRKLNVGAGAVATRGTEFECLVLPDGSGNIKLYSGEVSITSKTGEVVTLKPGQMISFTKEKIGPVTPIPGGV